MLPDFLIPDPATLMLAVLAMACAGGIGFAVIYPLLSGDLRREKRFSQVSRAGAQKRGARTSAADNNRRKSVEDVLANLEEKNRENQKKTTRASLSVRMRQAGLSWSKTTFFVVGFVAAAIFAAVTFFGGAPLYLVPGAAFVGFFGFPRFYVSFLRKRRLKAFGKHFPDAIDVIVRGVKAGLPLGDCLKIIATEAPEPVRSEFRDVVEAQQIGLPLGEAINRLYTHVPIAETNFFAIVIAIQQKAGGNLSEALGNLSNVLRERKKMKGKVDAVSQESKTTAMIIGAVPFLVILGLYLTSPDYLTPLWTTQVGNILLGLCGVMMISGILVIKNLINFDI